MHDPDGGKGAGPSLPGELRRVVDAWDELPAAVRAGIVAMVDAAAGKEGK